VSPIQQSIERLRPSSVCSTWPPNAHHRKCSLCHTFPCSKRTTYEPALALSRRGEYHVLLFCSPAPAPALSRHEYVACQAQKAAIAFSKQDNCFTTIPNAADLAKVADTLSRDEIALQGACSSSASVGFIPPASVLRKPRQGASPPVLFGVVHDDFDAKYAFAFGIDLQHHFAVIDLEDRHVIRRFLDHDSPSGWILLALVIVRAILVAEDRL
jgi:hypothetical protein